jgi:predicted acetyltransferase
MSSQIIQLGVGEFDEAMGFLDTVFGEHRPHDFARMLPAIYQPTDEHMRCNYAVREGGRIAAVVGVFPINWRVGGVTLKVAGIGGVAVHPDSRGKGYMKLLMNHAVAEIRSAGYDLSYLGGRRQRYAYFGYEVAGCKYKLTVHPDNIRHAFAGRDTDVKFEPATDDAEIITSLKTLHDAQAMFCVRPAETFCRYLKSWNYEPIIARDTSGQLIGYISAHPENAQINELVARDVQTASRMLGKWVSQAQGDVVLLMHGPIGSELRALSGFAETTTLGPSGNWQVFNWVRVVDALMRIKHAAEPMSHGSVTLEIDEQMQRIRLVVDDQGARCEPSDGPAVLKIDSLAAIPLLFGPLPPAVTMPLPPDASLLSSWCPLPLGISPQDKV